MEIWDAIGGFLRTPQAQTELFLKQGLGKRESHQTWVVTLFAWAFLGTVLVFIYLYPELLYYSESRAILNSTALYVAILGQPLLIFGVYLIAFLFVVMLNQKFFGRISFIIGKKWGQNSFQVTKQQYRSMSAYSILPFFIWGIVGVIRVYFGEKIHIAEYSFPFFLWSIQNILYWSLFAICLGYKWAIGIAIQKKTFNLTGKILFLAPCIELGIFLGLLGLVAIVGDSFSTVFLG